MQNRGRKYRSISEAVALGDGICPQFLSINSSLGIWEPIYLFILWDRVSGLLSVYTICNIMVSGSHFNYSCIFGRQIAVIRLLSLICRMAFFFIFPFLFFFNNSIPQTFKTLNWNNKVLQMRSSDYCPLKLFSHGQASQKPILLKEIRFLVSRSPK